MSKLANRVLVVIGGTAGVGLSAAKAFVTEGATVVVVGRNVENVKAAQKALGKSAEALAGDASDPKTAAQAIQTALKTFGAFHGLYHVAGGSGRKKGDGPLHDITDEGWQYTSQLNLTSLFYSNRAAAREFLHQKSGGSILNMSSVLGWSPSPKFFSTHAYAATKAAAIGLTKSAAACYAKQNIRFNVLAPALVADLSHERADFLRPCHSFIGIEVDIVARQRLARRRRGDCLDAGTAQINANGIRRVSHDNEGSRITDFGKMTRS